MDLWGRFSHFPFKTDIAVVVCVGFEPTTPLHCFNSYTYSTTIWHFFSFLLSYVGEGHGGLDRAQQRKKEESERRTGRKDQIEFIDLRFERWQVVRFRKARGRQSVPQIASSRDE